MKPIHRFILSILAVLFVAPAANAADIVYLDAFNMFADRSILTVQLGIYQNQAAMKLYFGSGSAARNVGVVFAQTTAQANAGASQSLGRLLELLNDPKKFAFGIHKELSTDLGLTFQYYVPTDQVK